MAGSRWIYAVAGLVASISASQSASYAGPCTSAIDTMQARIDAKLQAKAAAGPSAKEGTFAGMSQQPTPRTIAAAEVKLGEISARRVDAIQQGMVRARAADAAGDKRACRKALTQVRHALSR